MNTQEALAFSSQCQCDPKRLSRLLHRELDWIVLKCLQKDRERRYDSAAALADDVGRFLRGEPIRARSVSGRERLWKWARRKPALAGLLGVCSLLLTTLIVGGLVYNARLRLAIERAEDKEAETRRQYRQAHDTLDRMLGRLEGERLADVPQLKELQRSLLEDALIFYQDILQQSDSPDPVVRKDAAVACRRAADIQQILGQNDSAMENYRRTIELIESLPAEDRDSPGIQVLKARCYINWATAAGAAGRPEELERHNQTARDLLERHVREWPDDPGLRNDLATAEHNWGGFLLMYKGKPAEAEPHYLKAVSLRMALVRDHPEEESYQAALGADYQDLGLLYHRTGQGAEASSTFAKAEALLRPLVDRHPTERKYALSLVALYITSSYGLTLSGRSEEALDRLALGVRLAEDALRREPQDTTARARAIGVHGTRAEIFEFLERFADAAKEWDRVVELESGPARISRRGSRAWCLVRAGDHARAVAEAGEWAALPDATDETFYSVARIYSRAIEPALGDKKLSATEREQLAERYAAQAMALLRKLQNKGYFQDAGHAKALGTDENLQPLRAREDFRRLIAAVGNK